MMRKKRKDFAVSFKEKCYVINKYEKNRKKEENAMRKMLFFYVENQQKLWKVKEEWEKRKDFGEYTCIVKLF